MREITIKFSVTGTCCQTIRLDDECELTAEEIVEELNMGGLVTATHEGSHLCWINGFNMYERIGKIVGSDMSCELEDYENVSLKEL